MNARELKKVFNEFNRLYFGSKLPDYHIRTKGRISPLGEVGLCVPKGRTIWIFCTGEDDQLRTLIHEMAHIVAPNHGPRFFAEMERLKELGAPVGEMELSPQARPRQLTKVAVGDFVLEAAMDESDVTFASFVRYLYQNQGRGNGSQKYLCRRYPWVKRAFEEALQARIKYEAEVRHFRG